MKDALTINSSTSAPINQVLRNTYWLLSLTLLFSAAMAAFGMSINAQPMNPIMMIIGIYGLMFLTQSLRNSPLGLVSIFAFTGFMGYSLAPILTFYLQHFSNGGELVVTSLGATGLIFLSLSAYALLSRKSFSYLAGFLFVASLLALMAGIASVVFDMPVMNLVVSGAFALIASGLILFETSAIMEGGENNYIMATISLYVSFFNLFISLLRIFGAFAGREEN